MHQIQRVRAVLVKNSNSILLIKRVRDGMEPYFVTPGGGIEGTDSSIETALEREVLEELDARINIRKLVFVLERQNSDNSTRELFFLCEVIDYNFERRTGPEFTDPSRGYYSLEEIKLTEGDLRTINIKPDELKQFLVDNHSNLFSLPDIRSTAGR